MKSMTARQQEVLAAIIGHWKAHSLPPTVRDICRLCNINSTNGVMGHLRALRDKGQLLPHPEGKSRSIVPTIIHQYLQQIDIGGLMAADGGPTVADTGVTAAASERAE
mgnify:CR=1 FL=1